MDHDDEDGLEEQVDCIAGGEPKVDPEDVGDEQDGCDVDGEAAEGFLLFDQVQLRVVAHDGGNRHSDVK